MSMEEGLVRVAVIGAGPIGIEMAINLVKTKKYIVTLLEKGKHIAAHIQDHWSHVELFSPNDINMSKLGKEIIVQELGQSSLPNGEDFFTGGQFVEHYLKPLETYLRSSDRCELQLNTTVVSVCRKDAPKHKQISDRSCHSFLLLCCTDEEEYYAEADVVIDASGTYSNPNYMGPAGLPAIGERELRRQGRISCYVPDTDSIAPLPGFNSSRTITTAVVGSGASAITTIKALLRRNELWTTSHGCKTNILWITRTPDGSTPYEIQPSDPLPQREALYTLGNRISASTVSGADIQYLGNRNVLKIESVADSSSTQSGILRMTLQACGSEHPTHNLETFDVCEIVANCGYSPDISLTRELQVHYCYASEGPMKLAAAMLATTGASSDCLAQVMPGKESLRSPESRFFIVGMKSYGRGSTFLMRIGYEQIEHVMSLLDDDNFTM